MTWLNYIFLAVLLTIASILLMQNVSLLRSKHRAVYSWGLTLFGAVLITIAIIVTIFVFMEQMVLSPEFNIVMIRKGVAHFTIRILIIVVAVCAGLGWALTRTRKLQNKLWVSIVLLICGCVIGGSSAVRLRSLNLEDQSAIQIFAYDLWWPPLLIWCLIALINSGLILLYGGSITRSLWISTLIVAALSIVAICQPLLTDPLSRPLWIGVLFLSLPGNMVLSNWLVIAHFRSPRPSRPWLALRLLIMLSTGAIGLFISYQFWALTYNVTAPFWAVLLWLLMPIWFILAFITAYLFPLRNRQFKFDFLALPKLKRDEFYIVVLLSIMVTCLIALFSATNVSLPVILAAASIAWILLTGAAIRIPVIGLLNLHRKRITQLRFWKHGGQQLPSHSGDTITNNEVSQDNTRTFRSIVKVSLSVIIAIILLIAVTEALNIGKTIIHAIPTRGPAEFGYLGQSVADRVAANLNLLNQQLQPETILVDTGSIRRLGGRKPIDIVTAASGAGTLDNVVAQTNELEIFGVKVPLGAIVTPIQMVIRDFFGIRSVMGSLHYDQNQYTLHASSTSGDAWEIHYPPRTIDLTITDVENNAYQRTVPLVLSSQPSATLETQVLKPVEILQLDESTLPLSPTLQLVGTSKTISLTNSLSTTDTLAITIEPIGPTWHTNQVPLEIMLDRNVLLAVMSSPSSSDKIDHLADNLTFNILNSNDAMHQNGMTKSYSAFQHFQLGLHYLQQFEELIAAEQVPNHDILANAIHHLQRSIYYDSAFALAHYRLGIAFQKNGQPQSAVAAFQASLRANTKFGAARNALAYTLYNFDDNYHPHYVPAPTPVYVSPLEEREKRKSQAMNLWKEIILSKEQVSLLDRASAYYGLCLATLDIGPDRDGDNILDINDLDIDGDFVLNWADSDVFTPGQTFNIAYFYCHQAKQSYSNLPQSVRSTKDIQQALSSVYFTWGYSINQKLGRYFHRFPTWSCEPSYIDEDGNLSGPILTVYPDFAREAMPYYQYSLELQPDNAGIQCRVATLAFELGDETSMSSLSKSAAAHVNLGDDYETAAKIATFGQNPDAGVQYYRRALAEYKEAIERDEYLVDALEGYAYTFWKWHLLSRLGRLQTEPDVELKSYVEDVARRRVIRGVNAQAGAEQAFAHSTLAEVLFAVASNTADKTEALKQLKIAYDLSRGHRSYDEIRWDLAQAYLCANRRDEAIQLLDEIRHNEKGLEYQQFGHNHLLHAMCVIEPLP